MASSPAPEAVPGRPLAAAESSRVALYGYATLALLYIVAGGLTVAAGRLTGDEGWYTFSALEILRGRVPYRDFLFTQAPLMPYVYAGWLALTGPGLLEARLLSFLFGAASMALLAAAAHRVGGRVAGMLTALLFVSNFSVLFDVCAVKTQALTVLGTTALLFGASHEARPWGRTLTWLSVTALADTRLSFLPLLLLVFVHAWTGPGRRTAIAWLSASAALVAVSLLAPGAPDNVLFGVWTFHSEWYGNPDWSTDLFLRSFVVGVLRNQWPLLLAAVVAGACAARARHLSPAFRAALTARWRWLSLSLGAWALTTAIHVSRPIAFPTYQTSNVALLIGPVAVVLGLVVVHRARLGAGLVAALAACLALGWPTQELVIHTDGRGGLAKLDDAADAVRAHAAPDALLWAPSVELAVETGLRELPGWELSEFSWFQHMDEARARRLHVTNEEMLAQDLAAARPDVICLTKRQLDAFGPLLFAPDPVPYRLAAVVDDYGQFFERMHVFVRR